LKKHVIWLLGALGLVVIIILLVVILGALPMFTSKKVTNSEVESVALAYAKSRCRQDETTSKGGDGFCDNLSIELGNKVSDAAAVTWSAYAKRSDTKVVYSSFIVDDNKGTLKVDGSTYVSNKGQE